MIKILPQDIKLSKSIFLLGLPIILSNLSRVIMTMCDTAMVGRLEIGSLSAVGIGGLLVFIFTSIGIALRTATQAMVSRRLGEKKYSECGDVIRNAILFATLLMLPLSIFILFISPYIIPILFDDLPIKTIKICIQYVQWSALSIFFTSIAFTLAGFFSGIEHTSVHIETTLASNILNVYLNCGLIFGNQKLLDFLSGLSLDWLYPIWSLYEFPELGVKGAAIATTIASGFMFFHYLIRYYFLIKNSKYSSPFSFDTFIIYRLISLGSPLAIQLVTEMSGFVMFKMIISKLGTIELDASEIVFNVAHASFLPAAGLGQACATLVGKSLGENNQKKAYSSIYETIRLSAFFMGTMGLLFILFPYNILRFFSSNYIVIETGIILLQILGIFQIFDAMCQTLWFSLNGAGDTKFPAISQMICMWGVFIPLSWISVTFFSLNLEFLWSYFILYLILLTIILYIRIKSGKWLYMKS